MRKWRVVSLIVLVSIAAIAAVFAFRAPTPSHLTRATEGEQEGERAESEGEDAEREAEEHVGASVTAEDQGPITRAEVRSMAPRAPAPGWAGEIKLAVEDTWEPTLAADPNAPYLYVMYNRFGGPKACARCPNVPMYVRVSKDDGISWGPERYLCRCKGVKFQFDPVLRVDANGDIYATWMNGYDIMFSRSSDHGRTWREPIEVSGSAWADKTWIGVSPIGTDVYIAFESRDDVRVAASHDGGTSFSPAVKLNHDAGRYRYPNGLEVLPDGTALLSASGYVNGNGWQGAVQIEIWRTTDGGTSWSRSVLANLFSGVSFRTSSTTALASDADGTLVALYTGATELRGNGHVWSRRSTDGGTTWEPAIELDDGSGNASFPAITGGASGDFRLHYADARNAGWWNTYYRSSADGGQTWSTETDIADAKKGASYKRAKGFASEYGDYGTIDITDTGTSVAVWGEGVNFSTGPGAIWFNRMT